MTGIKSTSIAFQDDGTAWLVFKFGTGLSGEAWEELDRPCDTCGGETAERHGEDYLTHPCSDCINGRHTFTIEVEQTSDGEWLKKRPSTWTEDERRWVKYLTYGGPAPTCSLRVSVVPGVVLPIVEMWDSETPCVLIDCTNTWHVWSRHPEHGYWFGKPIILRPNAKPGGWAAQLVVGA